MRRHIIVSFSLTALVACSPSPPKAPRALEACVASTTNTAQGPIAPVDVRTTAVMRPGDVACFAVDSANNVQAVPQAPANTPHISARMSVEPGMTMLIVENGMSSTLAYRALIRLPGTAEWQETSIVPVMAGLSGSELWPEPIDAIALFEMRQDAAR
jgi:hypothetical protein